MDRHVIAHGGQPLGLPDDGLRILVAQQDIGNFRHAGYRMSLSRPACIGLLSWITFLVNPEDRLNKQHFFAFLHRGLTVAQNSQRQQEAGRAWVFPEHG